jgi:hypothetical protein
MEGGLSSISGIFNASVANAKLTGLSGEAPCWQLMKAPLK